MSVQLALLMAVLFSIKQLKSLACFIRQMYKLRYVWQSYTVKAGYESNRPFCLLLNVFTTCLLPLAKAWGFFIFGVSMIGYGLVNLAQVKHFAQAVCDVLGKGEQNSAVYLLCETAAAETQYGTYSDPTPNGAGRGLYQNDQLPFKDTINRASQKDIDAIKAAFDVDLKMIEWDDLNYSPLLATIVARLHYKLRPGAVPQTLKGRAEYWKKHYNSVLGKGTVEHYIASANKFRNYY
jgi:hypothetical protein